MSHYQRCHRDAKSLEWDQREMVVVTEMNGNSARRKIGRLTKLEAVLQPSTTEESGEFQEEHERYQENVCKFRKDPVSNQRSNKTRGQWPNRRAASESMEVKSSLRF